MKKWKKYSIISLLACMVITVAGPASADPTYQTNMKVMVQGEPLKLDKQAIYTDAHNRTIVPIRLLSESMGAMVHWDKQTRIARVYLHPIMIELKIGEKEAIVRQVDTSYQVVREEKAELDAEAKIIKGRIYVPLHFVLDKLLGGPSSGEAGTDASAPGSGGTLYHWNAYTNTLSIQSDKLRDPMMQSLIQLKTRIEKAIPRLKDNVFINSETDDVLLNLSGNGSMEKTSMGIRIQQRDIANKTDAEQLKFDRMDHVFVSNPQDMESQKALKEILKLYFPVSYESIYKKALQKKNFYAAHDGKSVSGEWGKNRLNLWINYLGKPSTVFDKATVDIQRGDFSTALFDAAEEGYVDIVKLLLEEGQANPLMNNSQGENPLMKAAAKGHLEIVKILHDSYQVDVNSQTNAGETALMMAAAEGYTEVVAYLLERGANPNMNSAAHETALMKAVKEGHFEIVKLLLFN